MATQTRKSIRWQSRGIVWQLYDADGRSQGAWASELVARSLFNTLTQGAKLMRCEDFGGWPPAFMGHMKRVELSTEVKA